MITIILALAAATTALGPATVVPSDPAKAEKKICKSQEVTGSLARRVKICRTSAQWRAISEDAVRDTTRLLDQGAIVPTHGG